MGLGGLREAFCCDCSVFCFSFRVFNVILVDVLFNVCGIYGIFFPF